VGTADLHAVNEKGQIKKAFVVVGTKIKDNGKDDDEENPGTEPPGNNTDSPGTNGEGGYIGEPIEGNGGAIYEIDGENHYYYSYTTPVTAYYIEYTLNGTNYAEAYENKEHADVHYWEEGHYSIMYHQPNGRWLVYNSLEPNYWDIEAEAENYYANEWVNKWSVFSEYPLGQFAGWISTRGGGLTFYLRQSIDYVVENEYELPDNADVTKLYVRTEKYRDVDCLVFEEEYDAEMHTFWVHPDTGFTFKYQITSEQDGTIEHSFEVTYMDLGSPDWNEKHLRPVPGDKVGQFKFD
jgi:hypothetical protein